MKLVNALLLTLVLVSTTARSQEDPRVTEFENAPTDKALLLFLDSNEPPERSVKMMRSTLHNKRYDLLSLIFKEHQGFIKALDAIIELSDSSIKDESVLVLLRTDSAFWYRPPPPMESDVSRSAQFDNAVEPFVGVINKYLPGLAIDEELFSTKTKRLDLADELGDKMNGEVSQSTTKEKVKPRSPRGDFETLPQETPTEKVDIAQNSKEKDTLFSSHIFQATLAIVVMVFIALIWALKRKTLR